MMYNELYHHGDKNELIKLKNKLIKQQKKPVKQTALP